MGSAIGLREDFDGAALRRLARLSKSANQARRLLALAQIYDGGSRSEAAKIGGVTLQIVRDWMIRFNACGPDGLLDGKDEVVILCGGKEIARHPRCYGEGAFIADPLHYLALIETKPGALDQAAALQGWNLPEVFQHLRHLLEARMGNRGKREFIQVLRLLEDLPLDIVTAAVTQAIHIGVPGFDAIKLIALARLERRPARLDLTAYPHLPKTAVKTTSAADYAVLTA